MIPIITPDDNSRPSSRPFVINNDTGTTGTATGDEQVRNYCDLPQTEASRYHLDMPDHQYIFQFQSTVNGVTKFAYCLDKFADGPYNDVPYQSAPFETIFPNATARQKQMLFPSPLPTRPLHWPASMTAPARLWMTMTPTRPSRWRSGYF